MASTNLYVTVTNNSDIPIRARLIWAKSEIGSSNIDPTKSGNIGCEWKWYDLRIMNRNNMDVEGFYEEVAIQTGVYGESSWSFAGTTTQGYQLIPDLARPSR
jgi:hypothetical protein